MLLCVLVFEISLLKRNLSLNKMDRYQFLEAFEAGSLLERGHSIWVVDDVFGIKASHFEGGNKIVLL